MIDQERQIWIVDFGSQYTQLITKKTRELNYSSEILTVEMARERVTKKKLPQAIVLSGGPHSIFDDKDDYKFLLELDLPLLGICYGLQILSQYLGGAVEAGVTAEYGDSIVEQCGDSLKNVCPPKFQVWMSHFDHVAKVPDGFELILRSQHGMVAGILNREKKMMGLQFHPEVDHTDHGNDILDYFFSDIAKLKKDWVTSNIIDELLDEMKPLKGEKVLCAFSGGVDSLVAASLAHQVFGTDLHCFFVDHGLLRPQDHHHIETLIDQTGLNIKIIDAKEDFLSKLLGVSDPEKKRKIIGHTFIDVFEKKVHQYENEQGIRFAHLLQGTLYPDVIESVSPHKSGGKSVTIKSHHNVGGLPEKMKLKLIEPLRFLFKDEGRKIGLKLGLEHDWVYRHPFPGPGIGIRVLGELDQKSIDQVGKSDQILFEELHNFSLYNSIAQAFTVLLPVHTVGVKGDGRVFERVICLRLVSTSDYMTASWSDVPRDFLTTVSRRITNEVVGITRVVYDVTSKPPGTIEWE